MPVVFSVYDSRMTPSDIVVSFGPHADPKTLTPYALGVLKDALAASGNLTALITSLGRSPYRQALAMYENLEKPGGVAVQRKLYSTWDGEPLPGQKVIDTYEQSKAAKNIAGDIICDMCDTILVTGPSSVSAHCANPAVKQVMDVDRAKLAHPDAFFAALKADGRISKVLDESANGCIHCEIPQKS